MKHVLSLLLFVTCFCYIAEAANLDIQVRFAKSGNPVPYAKVTIASIPNGRPLTVYTNINGFVTFQRLIPGTTYRVDALYLTYPPTTIEIEIPTVTEDGPSEHEITLRLTIYIPWDELIVYPDQLKFTTAQLSPISRFEAVLKKQEDY